MSSKRVLAKIDQISTLVDLKVLFISWIFIDVYRNTAFVASFGGKNKARVTETLQLVWEICGQPYLIWIPVVIIADVLVKRAIRSFMFD